MVEPTKLKIDKKRELKIDKGVPIPEAQLRGFAHDLRIPDMEEGDSVFAELGFMGKADIEELMQACRNAMSLGKRKYGRTFTAREVEEDGKKGIRVWRLK